MYPTSAGSKSVQCRRFCAMWWSLTQLFIGFSTNNKQQTNKQQTKKQQIPHIVILCCNTPNNKQTNNKQQTNNNKQQQTTTATAKKQQRQQQRQQIMRTTSYYEGMKNTTDIRISCIKHKQEYEEYLTNSVHQVVNEWRQIQSPTQAYAQYIITEARKQE